MIYAFYHKVKILDYWIVYGESSKDIDDIVIRGNLPITIWHRGHRIESPDEWCHLVSSGNFLGTEGNPSPLDMLNETLFKAYEERRKT